MENKQPNDIFVALLQKSDASVFDLAASDIVPANTQLLPMEDYKQSDVVRQMFKTPSGDFNEDALLSEINSPLNVIPLCPTCHWEFDNGYREEFKEILENYINPEKG